MRITCWAVVSAALLGAVLPGTARAAGHSGVDLSIEYGFNRITNGDGLNMPVGLAASIGFNANEGFAFAGDVRWNRKTEADVALNLTSFQAGPRFLFRGQGVTFYLQGVAGGTRASNGGSETKFSVMPGVGVDINVTDAVGIRLGGDYRIIFTEGEKEKDLLAHGGIVFRFGR